jgi:hypothetical protein
MGGRILDKVGGYETIYQDLVDALKSINLADNAKSLGLACNQSGQVKIAFLGRTYLLGTDGVHTMDGQEVATAHGSVLAGYLLNGGSGEPVGKFVPLDSLTGLVPTRRSYVYNSLESRLARYADKNQTRFHEAIINLNGKPGGEVGSGGKSWIFDLLPKIPVQLIFYSGDDEFPSEARLLFDLTAVNFLEFEFLAVLATIFVEEIIEKISID